MSRNKFADAKRRWPQLNVRLSPEDSRRFLAQAAKKGIRPVLLAAEILKSEISKLEKKEANA